MRKLRFIRWHVIVGPEMQAAVRAPLEARVIASLDRGLA